MSDHSNAPETTKISGTADHRTPIHWRTVIAACLLGLLFALAWVEAAEGGKGVLHAFWALLR
jgi:hypothetical protein